jgi:type IV secretory pathway VirB10-like protein
MNIDNQLILGVVFITAGIAMALLAYAAFLNRRSPQGEDEDVPEAEQEASDSPQDQDDLPVLHQSGAVDAGESEPPEPEEDVAPAAPTVQAQGSATTVKAAPEPSASSPSATAQLRRDQATGRLVIDVDSNTYRSMDALRSSEDWKSVDSLLSDLIAWLYKDTPPERPTEERGAEPEALATKPSSMVEQINDVLKEKLAERSDLPQAVRMVEGVGGSIRVFIGVQGYSLEEVPNDDIRALIRQAVAEWESRT